MSRVTNKLLQSTNLCSRTAFNQFFFICKWLIHNFISNVEKNWKRLNKLSSLAAQIREVVFLHITSNIKIGFFVFKYELGFKASCGSIFFFPCRLFFLSIFCQFFVNSMPIFCQFFVEAETEINKLVIGHSVQFHHSFLYSFFQPSVHFSTPENMEKKRVKLWKST